MTLVGIQARKRNDLFINEYLEGQRAQVSPADGVLPKRF